MEQSMSSADEEVLLKVREAVAGVKRLGAESRSVTDPNFFKSVAAVYRDTCRKLKSTGRDKLIFLVLEAVYEIHDKDPCGATAALGEVGGELYELSECYQDKDSKDSSLPLIGTPYQHRNKLYTKAAMFLHAHKKLHELGFVAQAPIDYESH